MITSTIECMKQASPSAMDHAAVINTLICVFPQGLHANNQTLLQQTISQYRYPLGSFPQYHSLALRLSKLTNVPLFQTCRRIADGTMNLLHRQGREQVCLPLCVNERKWSAPVYLSVKCLSSNNVFRRAALLPVSHGFAISFLDSGCQGLVFPTLNDVALTLRCSELAPELKDFVYEQVNPIDV